MKSNVYDIADGTQWVEVDPNGVDPTEDVRSPIDGMTESERRIWWEGHKAGYRTGWDECAARDAADIDDIIDEWSTTLGIDRPRRPRLVVAR